LNVPAAGASTSTKPSPFGQAVTAGAYPPSNSYTVSMWLKITDSSAESVIYWDGMIPSGDARGFGIVKRINSLAACVVRYF
jgi:hypothetical protein